MNSDEVKFLKKAESVAKAHLLYKASNGYCYPVTGFCKNEAFTIHGFGFIKFIKVKITDFIFAKTEELNAFPIATCNPK